MTLEWLAAQDLWLARWLFERLVAAIYFIAFLNAANQFPALLGENGLQPAPRFLAAVTFRQAPSIFHWRYSDTLLRATAFAGVVLSALLITGLPQGMLLITGLPQVTGIVWLPMVTWAILWVLYLSIVNIGQTFYSFGWESLLLEAGFLAIFLGPANIAPPLTIMWLLRWLLFRVEFGAGLIKIRHDRCWRDLTCLFYHHETQPMPNPLSWYFHHLPKPIHRMEVVGNHVGQLIVPFFLFAPQPVASFAALVVVIHNAWLILSGNFAWLNWLTLAVAVAALNNRVLGAILPISPPPLEPAPTWYSVLVLAVTGVLIALSYWPARNLLSREQLMNFTYNPIHLVNSYGAFGSITRERNELILEATMDSEITPATAWSEYEFKGKPGDPHRRPPQVAPYHLRLDWLMWFAAMSPAFAEAWLMPLVIKLLVNDEPTLRLLKRQPFPGVDKPPSFVRASLFRYRFTTWPERRATGDWWVRRRLGTYLQPVRLGPRQSATRPVTTRL